MSKHELDDAAYEALKAHPVMVEESMTNQERVAWSIISIYIAKGLDSMVGAYMRACVDEYVKEYVEEFASDEEISVNAAIHKLLNRCNGVK